MDNDNDKYGSQAPRSHFDQSERSTATHFASYPSTGATSPGAGDSLEKPSPLTKAAAIRADLSNYLALGCLCFEDLWNPDGSNDTDRPGEWVEISTVPILAFDQTAAGALARLLDHGWIRMQVARSIKNEDWLVFRIHLLHTDIGNSFTNRNDKRLTLALEIILSEIDTASATWQAHYCPGQGQPFDLWASADEDDSSLFYLFNKLPSPNPQATDLQSRHSRDALEDLLESSTETVRGLRTPLYPYQRRSAGAMLYRESVSRMELDPRYEERIAPDGRKFYYNARDLDFPRDPPMQQACQGGILAETMGLGKTLICLALILSTRDHPPKVPVQYTSLPIRPSTASLTKMAVSAINRKSIPWKVEFEREREASGNEYERCIQTLSQNPAVYDIPRIPIRWNRNTTLPPPQRITLTSTTIIVVPQNLLKQWRSEIQKHVGPDALQVLIMEDRKKELPTPDELRTFDIILFTRNRFDMEARDGQDGEGRRISKAPLVCRCPYIGATRHRDCHCLQQQDLYESPLKSLHFRRIIIDEGHFFSSNNTNTSIVANRLVKADHRWSVSGTPARDLLGVEVEVDTSFSESSRDALLEQRRKFNIVEDRAGAIDSLGSLASTFLQVEPFARGGALWKDHVFRHEGRKHTFSGFSTCLRRTLEGVVIKTRPEDVERDIQLPSLSHSIVRLKPSLYDIYTANLFTLVLTANAITSERTDADYLFHPNSQKSRYQLVSNLRKSTFFWTGFSVEDVMASISNARKYLAKEKTGCTQEDRELMLETLKCTDSILASKGWKALSMSHELGVFVEDWPESSAEHWNFDETNPLLTGISQVLAAQRFVNERLLGEGDPGEGLAGEGIRALSSLGDNASKEEKNKQASETLPAPSSAAASKARKRKSSIAATTGENPLLTKAGIPLSSIDGEPRKRNDKSARASPASLRVTKRKDSPLKSRQDKDIPLAVATPAIVPKALAAAKIVGTTSAKMSYLISQILKFHKDEKILVFYEGDNIAYYIAQALEMLDIKHEIYAKSLQNRLKSEYIVDFDLGADTRVLLMDVGQAAFGLNLSSASRIYFVNPVLRPQVESQAIKRAHRIGQTRKVHVETLLLEGTVEEKMFQRSKRMTPEEHRVRAVEDDGGMREIIQSSRILSVPQGELQLAPLESSESLWGREGWKEFHTFACRKRKRRSTDAGSPVKKHSLDNEHPQVIVKKARRQQEPVNLEFSIAIEEIPEIAEPFRTGSIFGPNSMLPAMAASTASLSFP